MPRLYIIAGPNGAGKTTLAKTVLTEVLKCREYVNADEIARGLSPFNADAQGVALHAGRIMLERIKTLIRQDIDLAFETTLATRSYAPLVRKARIQGYETHLIFLWINSVTLAKKRVRMRVQAGGHGIPAGVIERRYKRGISNLFRLYMPLVDSWRVYDNSGGDPLVVAGNLNEDAVKVHDEKRWEQIKRGGKYEL